MKYSLIDTQVDCEVWETTWTLRPLVAEKCGLTGWTASQAERESGYYLPVAPPH